MSDFNLIVSSLVLAILLPVSVAVLYALMASHIQLAPESAMHSAVVERFDSEPERAEYHAAQEAHRELRRAAVMAKYRELLGREIQRIDPRQAEPHRQALAAQTSATHGTETAPAPVGEPRADAAELAAGAAVATASGSGPRQRRPALWRVHQAHRQ